jgi:hypothetical protein
MSQQEEKDILVDEEVLSWLKGEWLSYVSPSCIDSRKVKRMMNEREKDFGKRILLSIKNYKGKIDTNQWSNNVCEHLVKKLLEKNGEKVIRCRTVKDYDGMSKKPDFETDTRIIEVKGRNYTTDGTAGQKIFSIIFEYACIPKIFEKPLYVVLVGFLEKEYKYMLEKRVCKEKLDFIEFCEKKNIFFIGASSLLK